ncbi:MAG: hypothetical protein VX777_03990 [Chlamydiota bacterium]|nr:hypothetical protein [Chlamydiota bacterium]
MTSYLNSLRNNAIETFNFIQAKSFVQNYDTSSPFIYQKGLSEKIGELLFLPVGGGADRLIRFANSRAGVITSTVITLAAASFWWYSEECSSLILTIIPVSSTINPGIIKFSVYCLTQLSIVGIGLRSFGRYNNSELTNAWKNKTILHINLGAHHNEK